MLDSNSSVYNGSLDIQLTHLHIHLSMKMTKCRYLSLELNLTHTCNQLKPSTAHLSITEIPLSLHPIPAHFAPLFILRVSTLATVTEAKIAALLLEKGEAVVV